MMPAKLINTVCNLFEVMLQNINTSNKGLTEELQNELIQEADKGDQWAQYYVGMILFAIFV